MEESVVFNGHLVYFTSIRYILCPLGTFCGNLVYSSPFWYILPRQIWQSCGWLRSLVKGIRRFPVSFFTALVSVDDISDRIFRKDEDDSFQRNKNIECFYSNKVLFSPSR
jgi:hypothetical protein